MLKIKKARPTLNHILTTADKYVTTQLKDGIVDTSKEEGQIKEYQRVISVGPSVRDVKVGDIVLINPERYLIPVHSLNENSVLEKDKDEVQRVLHLPILELAIGDCLYLYDTDVDLIIEDYEETE